MKFNQFVKLNILFVLLSIVSLFFLNEAVQAQSPAKYDAKSFRFRSKPTVSSDVMESFVQGHGESFIDAKNIWIGLNFTKNGGRTWKQMILTPRIEKLLGYNHGIPGDGSANLMIFFLNKKRGWSSAYNAYDNDSTWQTEDGGYTWKKLFNFKHYDKPFFLPDKKHGWFFVAKNEVSYVISTKDGGRTWSKHKMKVPLQGGIDCSYFLNEKVGYAVNVIEVGLDDSGRTIIIRGVVKTTDGGRNWKPRWMSTNHGERYLGLHFIDENEGWMWTGGMADKVILHTVDGGTTWKVNEYSHLRAESMYFVNKYKGWLLSMSTHDNSLDMDYWPALFGTTDAGKTWKLISMKEMEKNLDLYFGSKPFFPNWNDGNMFLFRLRKSLLIDECRGCPRD